MPATVSWSTNQDTAVDLAPEGPDRMSPRPVVAPERRAAIVRATVRCLARDGYAGLTMKRVAAEAGLSPGILHYYFRDKRAILARTAATVMAELDRRVATEARGARDARARLRALLRACLEVATASREFWSTSAPISPGRNTPWSSAGTSLTIASRFVRSARPSGSRAERARRARRPPGYRTTTSPRMDGCRAQKYG
jgi:AcrR family transcriptional regulator